VNPSIDVLYEDGPCLVVLKPPGLLTQAPPGIDSLEVRIKEFLRAREGRSGNMYLGVPHRLDRPASGALLFARHPRATRRLCEQFEARTVDKLYWAVVESHVEPDAATWTDLVRKVPGEPTAQIVAADDPGGRPAVLHYRVLRRQATAAGGELSWLEIRLETGRTHQVRIQAASRGWPVLGDAKYGAAQPFGEVFEDERLRAIALHARQLSFRHPMTEQSVSVTAPPPTAWPAAFDV
jgi:RluA family pseudouridine synthase